MEIGQFVHLSFFPKYLLQSPFFNQRINGSVANMPQIKVEKTPQIEGAIACSILSTHMGIKQGLPFGTARFPAKIRFG
jgi:hypothetical protein